MENKIYFAKLKSSAIIPSKEKENAGYDFYACFEEDFMEIKSHETKLVPTGIAWASPPCYYLQIEERSSTGSKGIKKSAGVVDSGYRGEIFIAITNSTNNNLFISKLSDDLLKEKYTTLLNENYTIYNYSNAIAQGILHRVENVFVEEISQEDLLNFSSNRGTKAFGSSDKF